MTTSFSSGGLHRAGLFAAMLVPWLYFGAQVMAAPFYPDYSFLTNSASQLGSDASNVPAILNTGAALTGLATLVGGYSVCRSLLRAGGAWVLVGLLALAMASTGAAALWAGSHPMPSPQHNPGALGLGMFAFPLLALLATWRIRGFRGLQIYLVCNLVAFAVIALMLSGHSGLDVSSLGGLMQRAFAATVYIPIGVFGFVFFAATKRSDSAATIRPNA